MPFGSLCMHACKIMQLFIMHEQMFREEMSILSNLYKQMNFLWGWMRSRNDIELRKVQQHNRFMIVGIKQK